MTTNVPERKYCIVTLLNELCVGGTNELYTPSCFNLRLAAHDLEVRSRKQIPQLMCSGLTVLFCGAHGDN
jgi:hypothetical protein